MSPILSFLVCVFCVAIAVYLNYPPLPQSPILFQWQSGGHYFKFGDYSIFYRDDVGTGKENLLCLHGFPTSSYDWYKVLPSLKQKFHRVVTVDFLGFGYSDKPRFHKYSIFEQADIVEKLMKHVNVSKVHILAHDYGDTVVQELLHRSLQHPTTFEFEIKSVCLLNGGIFPDKNYPTFFQKVLLTPVVGTVLSKLTSYPFVKMGLCEVFGPETQPLSEELHNFWSIMRYQDGYRSWGSLLSYIQERNDNEERWIGALQRTIVPVHMIYGPADPVNPPPFAEHYRNIIPKPDITVLSAHIGHYVQLEAPEEMTDAYFKFLSHLSRTTVSST